MGVGLLALALGVQTMRVGSLKRGEIACKAQARAVAARAVAVAHQQATITKAAQSAFVPQQAHIQTVTKEIVRNVPVYITPAVDRAFPLPNSFVRVHDASVSGSVLSGPAASTDDLASAITASHAATVIASNYGGCRANAAQLAALQGWVTNEQSAALKP